MRADGETVPRVEKPSRATRYSGRLAGRAQIVAEGLMSREEWEGVSQAAKELFAFGQAEAAKRGLILVDTKYEFGRDGQGNFFLIDEVHTPDSSRYWVRSTPMPYAA